METDHAFATFLQGKVNGLEDAVTTLTQLQAKLTDEGHPSDVLATAIQQVAEEAKRVEQVRNE
ncbi:hypothetical protein IMAU70042_02825 [Lactiplantibacillus plantarum]|nr:hypothetical protein [Lactiplantibacillus plantarum]